MKNYKVLTALVILLLAGYVGGGPFITMYQIKSAVEANDQEALSGSVDFPVLRTNIKEQLNIAIMSEMDDIEDNPFAALGMAFATTLVERAVDLYVTPAGIARLMTGEKPKEDSDSSVDRNYSSKPFENARFSYDGASKFSIWVPEKGGDDGEIRFVLSRQGLNWKLTNILIPMDEMSGATSDVASDKDDEAATIALDEEDMELVIEPPVQEKPTIIHVALEDKGYREADYMNGIDEALTLNVTLENVSGRDIRAFEGTLSFMDILDNHILSANLTIQDPIAKDSTISWAGELDYNQFMDEHKRFKNARLENMSASFEIEKVLYQDGEKVEY